MSWGIVLLRALLVVFFIGSIVVVNSQSSRPKKTQALRDFKNGARRAGIQHQDPAEYMGKGLSPEEKFHRVPLRPRMSNENWKKWAGPLLTKKYDVRKGDSLWVISKRLFGNPHLWPKVWELNSVFRNAHIIDPNVRLYFFPGNPQSTPIVSVKNLENPEVPLIPFPSRYQRLSLLERVAEDLKALSSDGLPAFRSYMAMQRPPVVARMPKIKDRERFFWRQGDELYLRLPVGKYFVVEHEELGGLFNSLYQVNIKGQIEVFRPFDGVRPNSEVLLSFVELEEGDALIQREFELAPKNIYFPGSNELGYLNEDFIFLERGFRSLSAVHMAVGARFRSSTAGPQVGSVVSLWKGRDEVGRLVLVDRDRNVGTFWVYEANRELREDDRFY